ncbi:hypothetical protein Tco_1513958 [Tanacetum coccineum]
MNSPLKSHLQSALNVLRYLKRSPDKGLKFTHKMLSNMLEGYADSLIVLNAQRLENLSLDIVSFTKEIPFLGKSRNKQLFPNPPLKLSTES